ncbi:hypothetical protein LCGC14_2473640 [marine sediment metagenome]|uniref:Peptidase S74 domain-containing protein n=1 Tax=marine sediment metagenome TaxID=412755 RepID=A0A0F9BAA9_9ZZZZ
MKILNTIVLGLAIFLTAGWLFATDYPGGGAADGFTDPTAENTWTADQTYDDDVNLTFGTGGDVDIDFNQVNLVINPQVVGTGHVIITETSNPATSAIDTGILNLDTTEGGNVGAIIVAHHNSGTPADNDRPFRFIVHADDSGATSRLVGIMGAKFDDVTSTSMDSSWEFSVMDNVNADAVNLTATLTSLGVWTDAPSFGERKEPERELTTKSVLNKVRVLDVYRFRGKGSLDIIDVERHISPTADAFYNAFKTGKDPRVLNSEGIPQYGIAARDVAGVALMAIQELIKENDKLKERLDILESN